MANIWVEKFFFIESFVFVVSTPSSWVEPSNESPSKSHRSSFRDIFTEDLVISEGESGHD